MVLVTHQNEEYSKKVVKIMLKFSKKINFMTVGIRYIGIRNDMVMPISLKSHRRLLKIYKLSRLRCLHITIFYSNVTDVKFNNFIFPSLSSRIPFSFCRVFYSINLFLFVNKQKQSTELNLLHSQVFNFLLHTLSLT